MLYLLCLADRVSTCVYKTAGYIYGLCGELTGLLRPEDRSLRPAFSINAETTLTADSLEKTLTGSGSINETHWVSNKAGDKVGVGAVINVSAYCRRDLSVTFDCDVLSNVTEQCLHESWLL
jgi:hypothetical protein